MPVRHSRVLRHSGAQRRKLVWATTDQSVTIPTNTYTNLNLCAQLAVAGSSLLGVTIMRTHFRVTCLTSPTQGDSVGIGLIIVKLSEIGAAVVGAATPANGELDWMLLDKRYTTVGTSEGLEGELAYDIRAKRKMQELNQAYALSLFNNSAASHTFGVFARTLIALP